MKLLFATGGTAGHINPALAVACPQCAHGGLADEKRKEM